MAKSTTQSGIISFAFRRLDRTIIIDLARMNVRAILLIIAYEKINKNFPGDIVLQDNNYEMVDAEHSIIDRLHPYKQNMNI